MQTEYVTDSGSASRSIVLDRSKKNDDGTEMEEGEEANMNQLMRDNGRFADQSQYEKFSGLGVTGTIDNYCNPKKTKTALRDSLLKKLKELEQDACFKQMGCDEDKAMDNLRQRYYQIMKTQKEFAKERGVQDGCTSGMPECMKPFHEDRQIAYLRSKISTLGSLSFNFLHRICENVTQGCIPAFTPDGVSTTVPENLLDCSGINDGAQTLFFHDRDIAAIGRQLAPASQRNGNSPAARGFDPMIFLPGTLAKGSDGLYVNVCVPATECEDGATQRKIQMRWVRANLMEVAAYETAADLRRRISARKRQLVQVAREMLTLQAKMYQLHPVVMQRARQQKPQICMPAGNASAVIGLGLKRMKANMMNKQCAAEIQEVRQTLDDQSRLICGKPHRMPGSKPRKSRSRSKSSRSKSKRSKSKRSKSKSKSSR